MSEGQGVSGKGSLYRILVVIVIFLLAISFCGGAIGIFGFWTVVPAGSVGVQDTFGSVASDTLGSGLHLKAPWTNVIMVSTQTEAINMIGSNDAASLTSEGVTVNTDLTVLYHIDYTKATEIYRTIGMDYANKVINPEIRGDLRAEIAKFTTEDIYSSERGVIQKNAIDDLNAKLNGRGIYIDDFIIRQVILPQSIQEAINAKQQMQQQITQKQNEVEVAKAEAQRKIEEANGIAEANKIIAGSLSDSYLEWYWIENVAGKNNTIYVPTNGLTPIKSI